VDQEGEGKYENDILAGIDSDLGGVDLRKKKIGI
jgi:hypothetical protein